MIATTIEQSKELLNAGLDPESADVKHTRIVIEADGDGYFSIGTRKDYHVEIGRAKFDDEIPAWSLSKLWDILHDSGQMFYEYPTTLSAVQVLDSLVEAVKRAVKTGRIK